MSSPFSHPANGVTWPTIEKYTLPLARSARKPFSPGLRPSSNNGDVGRADCGPRCFYQPATSLLERGEQLPALRLAGRAVAARVPETRESPASATCSPHKLAQERCPGYDVRVCLEPRPWFQQDVRPVSRFASNVRFRQDQSDLAAGQVGVYRGSPLTCPDREKCLRPSRIRNQTWSPLCGARRGSTRAMICSECTWPSALVRGLSRVA
jgi:hypothetical protein